MKYILSFSIALISFMSVCNTSAQAQSVPTAYERIEHFNSQITVLTDGSLKVAENIQVYATGDQIRHGIYRDFPTSYKDK